MSQIEITEKGLHDVEILVDGHDVAKMVTQYVVERPTGQPPVLHMAVVPTNFKFTGEMDVMYRGSFNDCPYGLLEAMHQQAGETIDHMRGVFQNRISALRDDGSVNAGLLDEDGNLEWFSFPTLKDAQERVWSDYLKELNAGGHAPEGEQE